MTNDYPDRAVILGAPDPEMAAIERLAASAGAQVLYALAHDGQRVTPSGAYQAALLIGPVPSGDKAVVAVECDGPALARLQVVRIDHHRPGDPGYGRGPAEFLAASSIGQVIGWLAGHEALPTAWPRRPGPAGPIGSFSFLGPVWAVRTEAGWAEVPEEIVLVAAADHCLAAAYRGECPGVDPDRLMTWRAASRAAYQRRPVEALLEEVEAARQALRQAPRITLGGVLVADLRDRHVPELPEAAARDGVPFLAVVADRGGGRKVVLQAAPAAAVEDFLARWAPENGLIETYGDPARGFAGGFVEEDDDNEAL